MQRLLAAWQTAEPFDACVLAAAAVFGLWILAESVRYAFLRWRYGKDERIADAQTTSETGLW